MKAITLNVARKITIVFTALLTITALSSNKNKTILSLPSGIVMCGAEFGQSKMPGLINKDYIYPTLSQFKYYASKGIKQIALPIRWERVQQKLFAPLDGLNIKKIEEVLQFAEATNIKIILDIHNYGRYRINNIDVPMGTSQVSIEAFADVWKKLATHFKNSKQIMGYQIMAEPHDLAEGVWYKAAQLAIFKIRETQVEIPLIIDGDNWASAFNWKKYSNDLKNLKDPANNIIYSAHCYFDEDGSGTYKKGYATNYYHDDIGIEKVRPFIEWLKENNKRGFIGEYGIPNNDERYIIIMEKFLQYLQDYNIGSNYWAAGSWWHNYPLSIEPITGKEKPQMAILKKFL